MAVGKTLVEKIWDAHRIAALEGGVDLLHIDRVVLHERSGGRMIDGVLRAGRRVRSPDSVFATIDHIIDTDPGRTDKTKFPGGEEFIGFFRDNAEKASVEIFDIDDERQGIVHVMAPELGIAQPGLTIVCG
ncbi:MAG: aconitase family protein, partial [Gammaproteobacteria bacterium]|nr:aconitase family protein [Gammaproteobacteria bacterium]